MDIVRTISIHLLTGFILTFLGTLCVQMVGGVGIAGGVVNQTESMSGF